jgi:hypothetical protein
MYDPALLNHHSHNGITVNLPPLFVHFHNLVYPDVAHEITGDENEIVGDDTMGVDITESIPWCERLLGGDNWDNLET